MSDSTMGLKQESIMLRSFEEGRGLVQSRPTLVGGVVVMMMASTVGSCLLVSLFVVGDKEELSNCGNIAGL